MKSLPIFLVIVSCLYNVPVHAQIGNYVLTAYESAMALKEIFEYHVENYRGSLTIEARDFGFYFTQRLATALERNPTADQGAALSVCAARATEQCDEAIRRFDATLIPLQEATNNLHLSVYQQLQETNIHATDLDLFYYYHSQRMDAAYDHLNEELLPIIQLDLVDLWLDYFVFAADLDSCIANVFA